MGGTTISAQGGQNGDTNGTPGCGIGGDINTCGGNTSTGNNGGGGGAGGPYANGGSGCGYGGGFGNGLTTCTSSGGQYGGYAAGYTTTNHNPLGSSSIWWDPRDIIGSGLVIIRGTINTNSNQSLDGLGGSGSGTIGAGGAFVANTQVSPGGIGAGGSGAYFWQSGCDGNWFSGTANGGPGLAILYF